jgi:hypothetical protein
MSFDFDLDDPSIIIDDAGSDSRPKKCDGLFQRCLCVDAVVR